VRCSGGEGEKNECAAVGEKGRRMSALQWGRRGEECFVGG